MAKFKPRRGETPWTTLKTLSPRARAATIAYWKLKRRADRVRLEQLQRERRRGR